MIKFLSCFLVLIFYATVFSEQKARLTLGPAIWYSIQADSSKVKIIEHQDGGSGINQVVIAPDSQHILYTTCNWLGFEGEGRSFFICRPDGKGRTLLFELGSQLGPLRWERIGDRSLIYFSESSGGFGDRDIIFYDFCKRRMVHKTPGRLGERNGNCFEIFEVYFEITHKKSNLCLDSLIQNLKDSLNITAVTIDCNKFDRVYFNQTGENIFSVSTLKGLLNKKSVNNNSSNGISGEITSAFLSPDSFSLAFTGVLENDLWGIYDLKRNNFNYIDTSNFVTCYNFTWSPNSQLIALVKEINEQDKEIIVLRKTESTKFAEQKIMTLPKYKIIGLKWSKNSKNLILGMEDEYGLFKEDSIKIISDE